MGHKMDHFMEQFGGCSRNVLFLPSSLLALWIPSSFLFFHPSSGSAAFPYCTLVCFLGRIQKLDWRRSTDRAHGWGWLGAGVLCAWEGLADRGVQDRKSECRTWRPAAYQRQKAWPCTPLLVNRETGTSWKILHTWHESRSGTSDDFYFWWLQWVLRVGRALGVGWGGVESIVRPSRLTFKVIAWGTWGS